jgi:hypothetical protein
MAFSYAISERLVSPTYSTQKLPFWDNLAAQQNPPQNTPYVEAGAWWALFNERGSGAVITINGLQLTPLQARTSSVQSNYGLQRISAVDGGSDIENITPMDSNNPTIPPEVLFRRNANITTTGSNLQTVVDIPLLNATRAMCYPIYRSPGYGSSMYEQPNSTTQSQVLREGEGLGILTTGNIGRENFCYGVTVLLTVGTNSYLLRETVQTGAWGSLISVFNGVGSGVIIRVREIFVAEITSDETTTARSLTVETISGLSKNSLGIPSPLIPMDTTNPDLPSGIKSIFRAGVLQVGADSMLGPINRRNQFPLRRIAAAPFGVGPGLAAGVYLGCAFNDDYVRLLSDGFVLREGEGIAIMQREDTSGWGSGYFLSGSVIIAPTSAPAAEPTINYTS